MGLISFIANGGVIGAVKRRIDAYADERMSNMRYLTPRQICFLLDRYNFGNGLAPMNNDRSRFTKPVHATLDDGREVTVAFGIGKCHGQTLIARGYLSQDEFYKRQSGHDHYGPNGELYGDRGCLD